MMRQVFFVVLCIGLLSADASSNEAPLYSDIKATVIGAGPAGIATMGVLLELGLNPRSIVWVDPQFKVGRLGEYYGSVPANTQARLFVDFLNACATFKLCKDAALEKLKTYDPDKEYPLSIIVEPLHAVTAYLRKQVNSVQGVLTNLSYSDGKWQLTTTHGSFESDLVVLATGSHPKRLNYNCQQEIPLDIALDKEILKTLVTPEDVVLVVGSSHSAILLLRYLSEMNVKKIINLYVKPIESVGLKGDTARWAHEVLLQGKIKNIQRCFNTDKARARAEKEATKVIYAVGFERNEVPYISQNPELTYDDETGRIAPALFGIGIAFPEKRVDEYNKIDYKVGLLHFVRYAQRVVPQWVSSISETRAPDNVLFLLERYQDLFSVDLF